LINQSALSIFGIILGFTVLYFLLCCVCRDPEPSLDYSSGKRIWVNSNQTLRTYIKQRNNKRRLRRRSEAPTSFSAPLLPPLPSAPLPASPYSTPLTPLPSAPFSPRSGPIVEVDIEIANTPNLLTVTENHKDECYSPSVTSLPPYDLAVMAEQLPTYKQAIAWTRIEHKK
jgi:hypothetical protein